MDNNEEVYYLIMYQLLINMIVILFITLNFFRFFYYNPYIEIISTFTINKLHLWKRYFTNF